MCISIYIFLYSITKNHSKICSKMGKSVVLNILTL